MRREQRSRSNTLRSVAAADAVAESVG